MSRLGLTSEYPTGGDLTHLGTLATVTGLRYSHRYPGGPWAASWRMNLPPDYSHVAVAPGRRVSIHSGGALAWRGWLEEPTPGAPWEFTARGMARQAEQTLALPTGGNALDLDDSVDTAISRGLPWTRPASLPTFGVDVPGMKLADALGTVAARTGQPWTVTPDGTLTMADPPAAPALILTATGIAGGRTLTDFANAIEPIFSNGGVRTIGTMLEDTASIDRYGRVEATLDMTGLGDMTGLAAAGAAQKVLDRAGARMRFSQRLTATPGQLLTVGGSPTEIALVRAGVMLQITGLDATRQGEVARGGLLRTVLAEVEYDEDSDTLAISPAEIARRDLATLLSPSKR